MKSEPAATEPITLEELQLAARNHGMPLEALRWAVTPVGLHYLLIHYDIPRVDPAEWSLTVEGHVERSLSLSLDDLRSRPATTIVATMECAGNGRVELSPRPISQPWMQEAVGTAEWTGVPLRSVLDEAALADDATEVVFTGLDRGLESDVYQHYERSLSLEDALGDDVLLAYRVNGQPLPPQHGFPLRLVVPGWYGMANVKWLDRITAVATPFDGFQQSHSYRLRQDEEEPGTPLTRMLPRSLLVPPGIPDFLTRRRHLRAGTCPIEGRAWSGWGPVEAVDVSVDGGRAWHEATLEPEPPGPHAWRAWSWVWHADEPGEYELCSRARDAAGNQQPLDPDWNVGGYANNAVHRVPVTVTGD